MALEHNANDGVNVTDLGNEFQSLKLIKFSDKQNFAYYYTVV